MPWAITVCPVSSASCFPSRSRVDLVGFERDEVVYASGLGEGVAKEPRGIGIPATL